MEIKNTKDRSSLAASLWEQQQKGRHCDVTLIQGDNKVSCHRCVLAVQSGYFEAMFSANFNSEETKEYTLPVTPFPCMGKILEYIYLGKTSFDFEDIESVYILADYLCITALLKECQDLLTQNINCNTWQIILELSIRFNIIEVTITVMEFISLYIIDFMCDCKPPCHSLSPEAVNIILSDYRTSYIGEPIVAKFLCEWANYNNGENKRYAQELMKTLNPTYFSKENLQRLLQDSDYTDFLSEEFVEASNARLQYSTGRMILCRSRTDTSDIPVKLFGFDLDSFQWHYLSCPNDFSLNGLQTMVQHKDHIYFLSSVLSDFCGYMHSVQEKKQFFSFHTLTGEWLNLPAPNRVGHLSQLISHINGVFIADRYGIVEMFDDATASWFDIGSSMFTTIPAATLHFLPMPMDRYIYFLRKYNLGYAPEYAEFTMALHILDTISGTSRLLSDIVSSELDLESDEIFCNYSIVPGKIFLKNSLGQTRVEYDMTAQTWERKDLDSLLPKCFRTIWGSIQVINKCYLVSTGLERRQYFAVYDWGRKQLKTLPSPDCQLSGLMLCTSALHGVCK